jgi:hypothetical protein
MTSFDFFVTAEQREKAIEEGYDSAKKELSILH